MVTTVLLFMSFTRGTSVDKQRVNVSKIFSKMLSSMISTGISIDGTISLKVTLWIAILKSDPPGSACVVIT